MRFAAWIWAGAILMTLAARAGEARVDLVTNPITELVVAVPKDGPLKVRTMGMDGAHFAGRVRLTGEYVYGREASYVSDSGWRPRPGLYFVPDAASRALLPYSQEDGPAVSIRFSNRELFLKKVLSRSAIAKIAARKLGSVRGRVTIWIDRYAVAVSCGTPVYVARFLRIEAPRQLIASRESVDAGGCG